jgi:hypothetical protein
MEFLDKPIFLSYLCDPLSFYLKESHNIISHELKEILKSSFSQTMRKALWQLRNVTQLCKLTCMYPFVVS